jgi:hypothetical protein
MSTTVYSQQLIIFVTYEWAQIARLLQYSRLRWSDSDEHSILLGLFVN